MWEVAKFSRRFDVRVMTDDDAVAVAALCRENPQFYKYCDREPSREQVLCDMHDTPPDTDRSHKYYVGFYEDGQLSAVMDIVDGYPTPPTAYIGFFMVAQSRQGQGVGSTLIREIEPYLKSVGVTAVRLAINKGNPQSTHFWEKNGFGVIKEVEKDGSAFLVAEKSL